MVMSPELVAFAIRSALRLGLAGRDALEQQLRDADFDAPLSPGPEFSDLEEAERIVRRVLGERVEPGGDLAAFWENGHAVDTPVARAAILSAAAEIRRAEGEAGLDADSLTALRSAEAGAASLVLRQWREGEGPPHPLARVGLALSEVALDFAGTDPSVFGVAGNGEKLVSALAYELAALLPDPDDPRHWPKVHFVERTGAIVLHAGLRVLADHPDFVTDERDLQRLVGNLTAPLVAEFDGATAHQPGWIVLRDTLFGPMASAAFETLAEHQTAFQGARFDRDKALGAITQAVLIEANTGDLRRVATPDGIVAIYRAALGVAVERPELFVTGLSDEESVLALELVSGVAGALRGARAPFSRETAAALAAIAIDAVGHYAAAEFGGDEPWSLVAGHALESFLAGVTQGAAGDASALGRLFSRGQATELARVVLEQAARTPGMLSGEGAGDEVKALVAAVTRAMAQDARRLLAPEDWLEIAAVAAREASRNPGRLFSRDTSDPGEHLAAKLIAGVLGAAAEDFEKSGRAGGSVLFGQTLREAIIVTLTEAAGQPGKLGQKVESLVALVNKLNQLATTRPERFGAAEWLDAYRVLVAEIAEDLDIASLSVEDIAEGLTS